MKTKIIEGVKKQIVAIIIGALVFAATFIKDLVKEGADVKFNDRVILVITEDHRTEKYLTDFFDRKLEESIKSPFLWYDALSSDYVGQYAETKATEVREEVEKELIKLDSIQKNFITGLGEAMGIRDDKVIEKLGEMGKKYIEGRLGTRTVTANF